MNTHSDRTGTWDILVPFMSGKLYIFTEGLKE